MRIIMLAVCPFDVSLEVGILFAMKRNILLIDPSILIVSLGAGF